MLHLTRLTFNEVEQLTGPIHSAHSAQIALRFPGTLCVDKVSFVPVYIFIIYYVY